MQNELEYTARFPELLYESLIWDSEEASVQILFSLDEFRWDYVVQCSNQNSKTTIHEWNKEWDHLILRLIINIVLHYYLVFFDQPFCILFP